jgi:hypothetical protein
MQPNLVSEAHSASGAVAIEPSHPVAIQPQDQGMQGIQRFSLSRRWDPATLPGHVTEIVARASVARPTRGGRETGVNPPLPIA